MADLPVRSHSLQTTTAILLRRTKLTETSLILTWLTRDFGRLKTVAKGARSRKSQFAGVVDLFFACEISYVPSSRSELHTLREVHLLEAHSEIRFDYARLALASYFAELLEQVTEAEHAVPELYDLLQRALGFLNQNPASRRALLHFEKELVKHLGIHQTGIPPVTALARTYHALPKGRAAVAERLV